MNPNEEFLYYNMQDLFYGLIIPVTLEGAFYDLNELNKKFDNLRTKIDSEEGGVKPKIITGGNIVMPLKTLKQYINDAVNNITPK